MFACRERILLFIQRRCDTFHMAGSAHRRDNPDSHILSKGTILQHYRDLATIHSRYLMTDTSVDHRAANTKHPAHRFSLYPKTLSTQSHSPTQTASRHAIL